ncbi:MAG: hypothetical protein ACR2KV_14830 [Solirubrobacteraceae bacterium]
MISAVLRTAAVLATLVLLASFSLFTVDQAGGASQQAQAEIGSTVGPPIHAVAAEQGARATLDGVDRFLLTPVTAFAPGQPDSWGYRSVALALGLLLYGVFLGILARSTGLARIARDPPRAEPHF